MTALMQDVASARDALKASFMDGNLASVEVRQKRVAAVEAMLTDHLDEASTALATDMGRPKGEADAECFIAIREARDIGARIATWAVPESHSVHIMMQPAEAAVRRSPFGAVLIIAPYNYPLLLAIEPLLGAIGAGNTVMLKPSELTPATAAFLAKYLPEYLPSDICRVTTGGVDMSTALLATQWDFIFFTGSPRVGRIVAKAAAEYMTPTALELGGKAPAIVHESAAVREAARRLINTKAINVGQTCASSRAFRILLGHMRLLQHMHRYAFALTCVSLVPRPPSINRRASACVRAPAPYCVVTCLARRAPTRLLACSEGCTSARCSCMAPDYVLVDAARHDELIEALEAEISTQFGAQPASSPDLGRMCTVDHFDRMTKLLATGGGTQRRVGDAPPDRATKWVAGRAATHAMQCAHPRAPTPTLAGKPSCACALAGTCR